MEMEDTSRLKIFTGNAHPELAKEICEYIGVPLEKQFVDASIMVKFKLW